MLQVAPVPTAMAPPWCELKVGRQKLAFKSCYIPGQGFRAFMGSYYTYPGVGRIAGEVAVFDSQDLPKVAVFDSVDRSAVLCKSQQKS
jgi:hypothetical protein